MNIQHLRYEIESSFSSCAQCDSTIDSWFDADSSEPGHPVVYSARDALFAGMCESGHVNEFYLSEVKAGEIKAHDITERTLGRLVKREDCTHAMKVDFALAPGESVRTEDGIVEGPAKMQACKWCHARFKVEAGKAKRLPSSGLIGLDGRPLGRGSDDSE